MQLSPPMTTHFTYTTLFRSTELGTNTWINRLLESAGVSGILVLVFINGLMALGRTFAGPVVHRLNPNGMLIFSALLDRKSTRLNSSHPSISYAVFCLKKKDL